MKSKKVTMELGVKPRLAGWLDAAEFASLGKYILCPKYASRSEIIEWWGGCGDFLSHLDTEIGQIKISNNTYKHHDLVRCRYEKHKNSKNPT